MTWPPPSSGSWSMPKAARALPAPFRRGSQASTAPSAQFTRCASSTRSYSPVEHEGENAGATTSLRGGVGWHGPARDQLDYSDVAHPPARHIPTPERGDRLTAAPGLS